MKEKVFSSLFSVKRTGEGIVFDFNGINAFYSIFFRLDMKYSNGKWRTEYLAPVSAVSETEVNLLIFIVFHMVRDREFYVKVKVDGQGRTQGTEDKRSPYYHTAGFRQSFL